MCSTEDEKRISMELYKEVYLLWCSEIPRYTGNVAENRAKEAVESFNKTFSLHKSK